MKYKIYCIFAKDSIVKMNGNRGKLAAQAGHAYLHSWWDALENYNEDALNYKNSDHAYKITLVVDTAQELTDLYIAYAYTCGVALIEDAGFTVFKEPTITCLGLGPIREDLIGDDLKMLKLLV